MITGPLPLFFFTFLLLISSSNFWVCTRALDCKNGNLAITVDQSGKGNFKTIQEAVDSISENNDQWVKVHINSGTYREKVSIPREKPCIYLEGSGRATTIITYDDHAQTDTSSTFTSFSDNLVATGITFQNSFNLATKKDLFDVGNGAFVTQAVAARIFGDQCAFYECGFRGFQDTLWDGTGRHYYRSCYIEGAIDFIFGAGQSIYKNCTLNVTAELLGPNVAYGYITAQDRKSTNDPSGFVFEEGVVRGSGKVLLGRAYGPYSRVVFRGTYFDDVVAPEGWSAWHYGGQEGRLTYVESDCEGPGADTSKRVSWMKFVGPADIEQFSVPNFLNQDGWLSKTPR